MTNTTNTGFEFDLNKTVVPTNIESTQKQETKEVKTPEVKPTPVVNSNPSNFKFTINVSDKIENVHKSHIFDEWVVIQPKEKDRPQVMKKNNYIHLVGEKVTEITYNYIKNYGIYKLEDENIMVILRLNHTDATLVAFDLKNDNFISNYKKFQLPVTHDKEINLAVVNKIDASQFRTMKIDKEVELDMISNKIHKKEYVTYGDVSDMLFKKLQVIKEQSYLNKLYSVIELMVKKFGL